jgi:hypothetical protein
MDSRLVIDFFIIKECKAINNKKKPFWLTFRNTSLFATESLRTMCKPACLRRWWRTGVNCHRSMWRR